MNILWIQPNDMLALTSIFDGSKPDKHAEILLERGDIPSDWMLAATNVDWPDSAWPHEAHRWDGKAVVVDYSAAVEVTKQRLRAERTPLLAALDVDFMRAIERGTSTSEVVAEKARLRDVTNIPDGLTLDELGALKCS